MHRPIRSTAKPGRRPDVGRGQTVKRRSSTQSVRDETRPLTRSGPNREGSLSTGAAHVRSHSTPTNHPALATQTTTRIAAFWKRTSERPQLAGCQRCVEGAGDPSRRCRSRSRSLGQSVLSRGPGRGRPCCRCPTHGLRRKEQRRLVQRRASRWRASSDDRSRARSDIA